MALNKKISIKARLSLNEIKLGWLIRWFHHKVAQDERGILVKVLMQAFPSISTFLPGQYLRNFACMRSSSEIGPDPGAAGFASLEQSRLKQAALQQWSWKDSVKSCLEKSFTKDFVPICLNFTSGQYYKC